MSEIEVQNTQLKNEINRLNRTIEKLQKKNYMLRSVLNKSDETKENDINSAVQPFLSSTDH
jgi:prefoldin subunit 5